MNRHAHNRPDGHRGQSASRVRVRLSRRNLATILTIVVALAGWFSTAQSRGKSSTTKPANTRSANTDSSSNGSSATANTGSSSNRSDPRLRRIGFRSETKLRQHYEKHGREFGNVTQAEYLAMAQDLRDAPLSKTVIETEQKGGTVSRFNRSTGAFMAFDRDLTIRTFFKPNDGEDYFRRAAKRSH